MDVTFLDASPLPTADRGALGIEQVRIQTTFRDELGRILVMSPEMSKSDILLPDGTPAEASVPRVLVARDQVIPIEPGAYVPGRREHDGTHHRRDEGHPEGPTDGEGPTGPVGELEDGEVTR